MPDAAADVLIVGAGPAGMACADELRARGHQGSVMLVGREADAPYHRPAVSKEYLRGSSSRDEVLLRPPDHWAATGVELLTRVSAMKLDPEARTVKLSDRREVSFGRLLLATGANVRRLRVDGAALDGIHYLRALANADGLRADLETARDVVIVGGSFLACEVAASLSAMGRASTVVMPEEAPLSEVFGARVGAYFAGLLGSHGVKLICGDGLGRLEPRAGAGEGDRPRVGRVVTESGVELDADLVVMATGAVPDVMLARAAGLELGETGGVRCTARLETSAPGIWAAGDMCEYASPLHGRPVRIEHWEVAAAQGRAVAASMLGQGRDFEEVPYFWSELADWCRVEYVGPSAPWDSEVVRGSLGDGDFTIFHLAGDRVVGALAVGREDDLVHAARLLHRRAGLGDRVSALGDPAVALSAL
ncbi:MAG: Ferredoxin reductase [uncultured Solirubrobacteraceae bacterium]|uniref:Ferredoxin reductase n=1 Tax=uncultured Solirubrobacteraceae bacterium TaxID=1162706 RepID=A0A6J4RI29_9ACTN|nr:MAG: Ferredoxin reductase [uncultured Solirubrobacteraceae bacterium]